MEIINDGAWFSGVDSITYQLPQGAYQWAQNTTNRGGMIGTRQGFAQVQALIGETKTPRGLCLFSTKVAGENPYLVAAIGSDIYAIPYPYTHVLDDSLKIANVSFPSTSRYVHFEVCVQAQETLTDGTVRDLLNGPRFVLIMQDGVADPAYWYYDQDNSKSGHITAAWLTSQGLKANPLQKASIMKWAGSRLWISRPGSQHVHAGDLLNPLQMVEDSVEASGGFFFLPGTVTGMGVTHDYKSLLVFTDQTTSAFQVGIEDRTIWPNTQDFQRVLFPGIGCVSHRTFINQYGMSWWMSHDGVVALDSSLQAYQTSRMHVKDHNMSRSKEHICWGSGGGCAGCFGNWLFFSVPSGKTDNTHTWVIDQAVVQSLNEIAPPAWCSNWTGIRPEQWVTGVVNGEMRCFCISRDLIRAGHQATIWEAFIGQRMDVPKSFDNIHSTWTQQPKDIGCAFETRFSGLSPSQYAKFRYAELDLAEIVGNVHLQVYYCGRRTSYKKILDKKLTATVSIDPEEEFDPDRLINVYVPQYRTVRTVTDTHDASDNDSGIQTKYLRSIDREFSLLVTWTGQMSITGIRMCVDPMSDYMEGTCEVDEDKARRITAEGSGEILETVPPPNNFISAFISKYLAPIRPRWVEFPSYDSAVANDVFFVVMPVISPAPGGYPSNEYPKSITLTTETVGADLRYTINGGDVTINSTLYTAPFNVAMNDTLKVKGFRTGFIPSIQVSGQYTEAQVATPVCVPAGGAYPPSEYPKHVTITCATTGATIRYTTNNTPVDIHSQLYSAPVSINAGQHLRSKAFKTNYLNSAETNQFYTALPQCYEPTFTPPEGQYPVGDYPKEIVVASTTTDCQIRYTINDDNIDNGTVIDNGGTVIVNSGDTLRARAEKTGLANSVTRVGNYTEAPQQVSEPTLQPEGGRFHNHSVTVTFHCATPNATIIYTIGPASDPPPDPTEDQQTGRVHDGDELSFSIGHMIIKSIAVRSGMITSTMREDDYDFDPGG